MNDHIKGAFNEVRKIGREGINNSGSSQSDKPPRNNLKFTLSTIQLDICNFRAFQEIDSNSWMAS